jgi:heme iron utilization protein
MNSIQAQALSDLVHAQTIAALGTLHEGAPYVSMVPYALAAGGGEFFIHVSGLAAHTADMLASPRVSLLIVSPTGDLPQSRARVTVQGDARRLDQASTEYAAAKACYIARFPRTADLFALGDFSIFEIAPVSARVVGGFAQAFSLGGESFVRALRETRPGEAE